MLHLATKRKAHHDGSHKCSEYVKRGKVPPKAERRVHAEDCPVHCQKGRLGTVDAGPVESAGGDVHVEVVIRVVVEISPYEYICLHVLAHLQCQRILGWNIGLPASKEGDKERGCQTVEDIAPSKPLAHPPRYDKSPSS